MDISLLNSKKLRPLLSLFDRREALQDALEKLTAQIEAALHGTASPTQAASKTTRSKRTKRKAGARRKSAKTARIAATEKPPTVRKGRKTTKAVPVKTGKRSPRGSMKKKILAALEAAGAKGVTARELSAKIKVPNQNIHVWFNSTGSKLGTIEKKGRGHWALKSA